jgi:hypothetical protein
MNFENAQSVEHPRLRAIRGALVKASDIQLDKKSDYLIKGWLGSEAVSVVYGDSNCGKSFFGLDMAAHVASGQKWNNCNVRKGKVLYLACEGGKKSYSTRLEAIKIARDNLYNGGVSDHFSLLPLQIDLHGAEDVEALSTALPKEKFALIVIDTLAMSMGAGSENDSKDMAQYIQNIITLRSGFNCHVMIIHHSGKDKNKGARGHSSLRAAVDTEIEIKVDGQIRTARCRKQRDLENGKALAFSLQRVELGLDDEDDPITSCVVEHLDIDVASIKSSRKLNGNQKIAMQALHEALAKHGRKMADTENYPASRRVVEKSQWRTAFLKIRIDSDVKEASVKKDFERQSQKLQEDGFINCFEDKVWIVHDEDRQDI